jgi:hypothetical protein
MALRRYLPTTATTTTKITAAISTPINARTSVRSVFPAAGAGFCG